MDKAGLETGRESVKCLFHKYNLGMNHLLYFLTALFPQAF